MRMERDIVFYLAFSEDVGNLVQLQRTGATGVMAVLERLSHKRGEQIRDVGLRVEVVVRALPGGDICSVSLAAWRFLKSHLTKAIQFKPDVLWLDNFRFEGHWEASRNDLKGSNSWCKFCRGKMRQKIISDLARLARKFVNDQVKLGYYAVPFKEVEHREWLELLGQDHRKLSMIFDYISPMLYHKMMGKPVSCIGEYISYLNKMGVKARIFADHSGQRYAR